MACRGDVLGEVMEPLVSTGRTTINVRKRESKNMESRNYKTTITTEMKVDEIKVNFSQQTIPFVFFGVKIGDNVKTYKLSTYKLLYDFIFQDLPFFGKDALKQFVTERFVRLVEGRFRRQSYPTRINVNEFKMEVGKVDIVFNQGKGLGYRLEVLGYELRVLNDRFAGSKTVNLKVPETRLFSKDTDFMKEEEMLLASDFSFDLNQCKGIKAARVIVRDVKGSFSVDSILGLGKQTAKSIGFFTTFKPKQLNVLLEAYRTRFNPPSVSRQLETRLLTELATELSIGETQLRIACPDDVLVNVKVTGLKKNTDKDLSLAFKFLHSTGIDVNVGIEGTTHQLLSVSNLNVVRKYSLFGSKWTKLLSPIEIQNEAVEHFICLNLIAVRSVTVLVGKHLKPFLDSVKLLVPEVTKFVALIKRPPAAPTGNFVIADLEEEVKLEIDLITVNVEEFTPDNKTGADFRAQKTRKGQLELLKRKSEIIMGPKVGYRSMNSFVTSTPVASIDFKLVVFKISELTRTPFQTQFAACPRSRRADGQT